MGIISDLFLTRKAALAKAHRFYGIPRSCEGCTRTSNAGATSFSRGFHNGDVETVRLLLEHGADPNTRSKEGQTPLHAAAVGLSEMAAATLRAERSITGKGTTLLDHETVVKLLIAEGSDVNARKTRDGATALIMAVYRNQEGVAGALLENGADINAVSSAGWAPLHVAAAKGNERLAKLLVDHGADVKAPGKDGRRPREVIGMSQSVIDSKTRSQLEELLRD